MAKFRVVHIDGKPGDWSIEEEILRGVDAELVVGGATTDDEVVAVAADADAILTTMYFMNRPLFEKLPRAQVVVRGGVGYDNLDVDAATDCGIIICNVVDYGYNEVANHAFTMLMALNRKLIPLDRAVKGGQWRPAPELMANTGRVAGQTLGLVAFGNIAQAVARRGLGFDMRVIAYDPYVDPAKAKALGVELVSLDEVLAQSDYISVHSPLNAETRGIIGERELGLMKPSAYLVVTARGGLVDEVALEVALRERRIAGAGLDVFAKEPCPPDHPLLTLDNIIVTPHFAWYSEVSTLVLRQRIAEAAADVLTGVRPRSVVNPSVLERRPLRPRPADG